MSRPIPEPRVWDEPKRIESRRLWAVIVLALDGDVARSILEGRPVLARNLDGLVLSHAMRGERLPHPDAYIRIRYGHLDAVAEAEDAICSATTWRTR